MGEVIDCRFLAEHPTLQRLAVETGFIDTVEALAELPRLESLVLDCEQHLDLFRLVDAPRLQSLEIHCDELIMAPLGSDAEPLKRLCLRRCRQVGALETLRAVDTLVIYEPATEVLTALQLLRVRALTLVSDDLTRLPALPQGLEELRIEGERVTEISTLPRELASLVLRTPALAAVKPLLEMNRLDGGSFRVASGEATTAVEARFRRS